MELEEKMSTKAALVERKYFFILSSKNSTKAGALVTVSRFESFPEFFGRDVYGISLSNRHAGE